MYQAFLIGGTALKHETFFATAATVIPVLLLSAFIQDRRLEDEKPTPRVSISLFAIVVLAAVAEFVCVAVLMEDDQPTGIERLVVGAAIWLVFLQITYRAAEPFIDAILEEFPWMRFGFFMFPVGALVAVFISRFASVTFATVAAAMALAFLALAGIAGVYDDTRGLPRKGSADKTAKPSRESPPPQA